MRRRVAAFRLGNRQSADGVGATAKMGDINQNIRVRVDAALNGLPIFQQFASVLETIKSHSNAKIQVGDAGSIANTNQLAGSIDNLAKKIDQLDDEKVGKFGAALHSLVSIVTALAHLPGAFEGLNALKNFIAETPVLVSKLAGAGTAIHGFFSLARDKLGDAVTAVKTKVGGLIEDIPRLVPGLAGASAGLIGLGAAAAAAVAGIAAVVVVVVAIQAALVAAVPWLFNLTAAAAETGSKFHDLSQQTGASVEILSALAPVAEDSNSSIEQLASGLGRFNKLIGEAAGGSREAKEDLKQFGIEPLEAIQNQDAALEKVFKRIIALPTGTEKAIAAQKAFGKSGAELIPTIIATGGNVEALKKKAQELGVYWTGEGAAAADEFGDTLAEIKRIVTGLANAIGQSLLPELLRLLRVFAHEMPQAGGAFVYVLQFIQFHVQGVTNSIIALIAAAKTLKDIPGAIAAGVATGSVGVGAGVIADSFKQNYDALQKIANTATPGGGPSGPGLDFRGAGGGGGRQGPPRPEDTSESQRQLDNAIANARYDALRDSLDREEKAINESYAERKLTIAQYYEEILRIEDQKFSAEEERLSAELAANQKQLVDALAKIRADRQSGVIQSDVEADAKSLNETNRAKARQVELEQTLNKIRLDRSHLPIDVEQKEKADTDSLNDALQKQIDLMDQLRGLGPLVQARQQIGEIDKLIEQFKDNPGMVALLEEWREVVGVIGQAAAKASVFEKGIELHEARIATLQEQGNRNVLARFLTDIKIREERKKILAILQEELRALIAIGAKDADSLKKIEDVRTRIEQLKNETKSFKDTFKDTFIDSVANAMENFFTSLGDVITGTKSLGDAFREMALSIIKDLEQIIAKMLVMLILKKLLGAFGGGDDSIGDLSGGLGVPDFAEGGHQPAAPGGRIIRVAEGGYDEVVLTTDPRHRGRTRNLLSSFLQRTGLLQGFDLGGWISAIAHPQFEIPAFAAGDWISAPAMAGAGGSFSQTIQMNFPNVRDARGFQLNRAAIERDLSRAARSGVERFRNG